MGSVKRGQWSKDLKDTKESAMGRRVWGDTGQGRAFQAEGRASGQVAGKNQNGDLGTEDLDGVLLVACGIPRTWGHKGQIEGLRVRVPGCLRHRVCNSISGLWVQTSRWMLRLLKKNKIFRGAWVARLVERLPLPPVMIPGS